MVSLHSSSFFTYPSIKTLESVYDTVKRLHTSSTGLHEDNNTVAVIGGIFTVVTTFSAMAMGIVNHKPTHKITETPSISIYKDADLRIREPIVLIRKHRDVILEEIEQIHSNRLAIQKHILLETNIPSCSHPPKPMDIVSNVEDNKSITTTVGEALFAEKTYQTAMSVLIQVESQFHSNARSDTGAIGLAQLTTIVCRDMLHSARGMRYHHILATLYDNGLFESDIFHDQVKLNMTLWRQGDMTWESMIEYLWHERSNPSVNVLLGGIYYRFLIDSQKNRNHTHSSFAHQSILEAFPEDEQKELIRATRAAGDYNGSDRILASGKTERTVHTNRFFSRLIKAQKETEYL